MVKIVCSVDPIIASSAWLGGIKSRCTTIGPTVLARDAPIVSGWLSFYLIAT